MLAFIRSNKVYLFAGLLSLVLSAWMSLRETVINPDGICYLQSAADIGLAGLQAAAHLCDQSKWPFYSALIYAASHVTHLSLLTTAYVLDALFSLISVLTFIFICQQLGASRLVLWLAAAVILSAHEFNNVREYIVRDHGFWAFYLLSLAFFLQYFRSQRVAFALLWSAAAIIATLFRIEGVIFLLVLPVMGWYYPDKTLGARFLAFIQLNALTAVAGIVLFIWLTFFAPQFSVHGDVHFSRLHEAWSQLSAGLGILVHDFHVNASNLAQHVLAPDAARDAGMILFMLLTVWYGLNVVTSLSLIYAFLVIYAWSRRLLRLDLASQRVLWSYILTNVAVTAIFMTENMFISVRYLLALSLVLMLWVPFALEKLLQQRKQQKLAFALVMLFLLMNAVGGVFDFGYSKKYIHQAGDWLAQNVPAQAALYSNDEEVMYYSRHFGNEIFAQLRDFSHKDVSTPEQQKQYDYLALRVTKHDLAAREPMNLTPLQVFANKRGDEVVIYKILH